MREPFCTICGQQAKCHPINADHVGGPCDATETEVLYDHIIGLEMDADELRHLVARYVDSVPKTTRLQNVVMHCRAKEIISPEGVPGLRIFTDAE